MNKGISDFFLYNNELKYNERKSQKNAKERQWIKKDLKRFWVIWKKLSEVKKTKYYQYY